MGPASEKRLLQIAVGAACIVPVCAGAAGVAMGPALIGARLTLGADAAAVDLDSHLRYLSGLLLAIGISFAACVPMIEEKGGAFRLLGLLVVCGGLARLVAMVASGLPSRIMLYALGMELLVTPLLMIWQSRVERRFAAISPRRGDAPHPLLGKRKAAR